MKHILSLIALTVVTSSFAAPMNSNIAYVPLPSPDATPYCGQRPSKSIFGGYTSINRSINRGETSVTRDRIVYYEDATLEKFGDQYYWAITVTLADGFTGPNTYAGKPGSNAVHISKARALVQHGNVIHWLYQPTHPERSHIPVR
ncbi:hypothetical protein [Brevifollis gellanilyticus]|uniref:DUF4430 domain-containing protein n=1 Tax=Brevifollis gellanilyticus TaxID=748831 RepID=A0A512M6M7_9BACT|nr:hypothetical protein [Brevifollis gellanilyticus]GEP42389.1 hypothetical protein BGE01nite_16800 [Brevifollis gellanilyticus]